jgi:hypothetical protein
MVKCPNCNSILEQKQGTKKFSAQIGNPEIAIIETKDPYFCNGCNQYFLTTEEIIAATIQVKNNLSGVKSIATGVYS